MDPKKGSNEIAYLDDDWTVRICRRRITQEVMRSAEVSEQRYGRRRLAIAEWTNERSLPGEIVLLDL